MTDAIANRCVFTAQGQAPGEIPGWLAPWQASDPPWVWCEPRPGGGLDDHGAPIAARAPARLHPLLRPGSGLPLALTGMPIDEARLFWPWGALHLLDRGGQVAWAFWALDEALPAPVRVLVEAAEPEAASTADGFEVATQEVLTRRDLARFGLAGEGTATLPGSLRLLCVRDARGLAGWTLTETGRSPT